MHSYQNFKMRRRRMTYTSLSLILCVMLLVLYEGSSRPLKSSDNAEEQGSAHGAQTSLRIETSGGKDKGSPTPLKSSENAEEQGQAQCAQPPLRIVTLVGEDVVLPCRLEPPLDAVSKSVEWARPDLEPRFVHVWHDGQDHMVNQNPSYKGRTSVSIDKLRQGDLSLFLSAVKLSDYGLYRCYFPSQNKTFSVELIVAGIFSITPPSSYSVIVAIVSGMAAGLLIAVVFIFWEWRKTQIMLAYIFSAKKKDSFDKKDQLRKQSMKTQEELSAWGDVLSPLMELKTGVVKQREKLRLQLEEIENEREENKKKIQSVEKEIAESEKEKATDRTEGYLREKQSLLNAQWKLEKGKEEVEKQQLNMDKLLQKTDSMNVTVTDRKRKVENQMEVIKSSLGELESDDENTHLV